MKSVFLTAFICLSFSSICLSQIIGTQISLRVFEEGNIDMVVANVEISNNIDFDVSSEFGTGSNIDVSDNQIIFSSINCMISSGSIDFGDIQTFLEFRFQSSIRINSATINAGSDYILPLEFDENKLRIDLQNSSVPCSSNLIIDIEASIITVPTLGEWGLITLSIMVLIIGIVGLKSRKLITSNILQ